MHSRSPQSRTSEDYPHKLHCSLQDGIVCSKSTISCGVKEDKAPLDMDKTALPESLIALPSNHTRGSTSGMASHGPLQTTPPISCSQASTCQATNFGHCVREATSTRCIALLSISVRQFPNQASICLSSVECMTLNPFGASFRIRAIGVHRVRKSRGFVS